LSTHNVTPRLLARPQTATQSLRAENESATSASVVRPSVPAPFEFAISEKTGPFEVRRAPENLLGLEVEYQDIHYTPPQKSDGSYEYLEKVLLACTKEKDGAGNHLFKIVGEGQFLDFKTGSHEHACIEVVSAPLTHTQWKNDKGVLGAYKAIQNMRTEIIKDNRTLSLIDFVKEYNQHIVDDGVDKSFTLSIPCKRFENMTLDKGRTRQGTSTQSNFTIPFESLRRNSETLESLTASTQTNKKKREATERHQRRLRSSLNESGLMFGEFFSQAKVKKYEFKKSKLSSFMFLFLLLESTYAQENAINPGKIVKFMYPWISKATLIDIIYSSLTNDERTVLYDFISTRQKSLHSRVQKIAKLEINFDDWQDRHLWPITHALLYAKGKEKLVEDSGILVDSAGCEHYDFFSLLSNSEAGGRIPPLDVAGVSSIVIEAREVSRINKMPTAELLQELEDLYK
jgi:hypothetical protein